MTERNEAGEITVKLLSEDCRESFLRAWKKVLIEHDYSVLSRYLTVDRREKLGLGELNKKEKVSDRAKQNSRDSGSTSA